MNDSRDGAYEDWAEMEELERSRDREAEESERARLRRLTAEALAKGIPEARYIQEMDGVLF